jgi:hypothetical protein
MSLIEDYLEYIGGPDGMKTETPSIFHRWSFMACVGAHLGRQLTFQLGHEKVYTNLYCMLMGEPGSRKSTAIKQAKKLLAKAGYEKFSAERTTKEKFFLDMVGHVDEAEAAEKTFDQILDANMWSSEECHEMFIVADEFNDFIGAGNIEFISILGSFWNYEGKYENRIKNGKSVIINNPTVSILGGNTPTNFSMAFPPELLGQGFFSRLLLIHGDSTGKRIHRPAPPDSELEFELIQKLRRMKETLSGEVTVTEEADAVLAEIYCTWENHLDSRFSSYAQRRYTHMLKLALIVAACNLRMVLTAEDVIYANTMLTHAEKLMPKALGQYGRAKNADVVQVVLATLIEESRPLSLVELWKILHVHFSKQADLAEIVIKLQSAGQIKASVGGKFIPVKKEIKADKTQQAWVDFTLLTEEERNYSV